MALSQQLVSKKIIGIIHGVMFAICAGLLCWLIVEPTSDAAGLLLSWSTVCAVLGYQTKLKYRIPPELDLPIAYLVFALVGAIFVGVRGVASFVLVTAFLAWHYWRLPASILITKRWSPLFFTILLGTAMVVQVRTVADPIIIGCCVICMVFFTAMTYHVTYKQKLDWPFNSSK